MNNYAEIYGAREAAWKARIRQLELELAEAQNGLSGALETVRQLTRRLDQLETRKETA